MSFGRLGALGRGFGRVGASSGGTVGGPFLLKVDGASLILLANGTDKLLITGTSPAAAGVSGSPIGILVSITYP